MITWLTYAISVARFNSNFSLISMLLYPIGVSVRDVKKFRDFELALQVFSEELPDQEVALAESYSP